MSRDLRDILRDRAPAPTRPLDLESLMEQGQKRRRMRTTVIAAVASMAVVGTALVLPQLDTPREDVTPAPAVTATPEPDATARSNPLRDLPQGWTELPKPPEARSKNAAIGWTGDRLIVWSGYVYTGFGDESPEPDGFAFDAEAREWHDIADAPLAPRVNAASAWTGSEFVVWGGSDDRDHFFDDGAAYDPATDTWRGLPDAPIDARAPLSVWTGRELIVWGADTWSDEVPIDGAAYDPVEDSWRTLPDAPVGLGRATAVWTGREMIVLGDAGKGNDGSSLAPAAGIAYDPATDGWRRLPDSELSNNASTASWNGREMIAWDYLNNTAAYDPETDEWRTVPRVPLEDYECGPDSVAIGNQIFGDYCAAQVLYSSSVQRWSPVKPPTNDQFGWGYALVAADPVVLLIGRNVETEEESFLAYRPPAPNET